jgi:hypothetical protein
LSISLSKRNASPFIASTSTPTLAQSCAPSSSLPLATDKSPLPTPEVSTQVVDTPTRTPYRHPHAPPMKTQPDDIRFQELEWEKEEQDLLASARAHMDVREYSRAFNLLKESKSSKARFLSVYSQFMVRNPGRRPNHVFIMRIQRRAKKRPSETGINLTVSLSNVFQYYRLHVSFR